MSSPRSPPCTPIVTHDRDSSAPSTTYVFSTSVELLVAVAQPAFEPIFSRLLSMNLEFRIVPSFGHLEPLEMGDGLLPSNEAEATQGLELLHGPEAKDVAEEFAEELRHASFPFKIICSESKGPGGAKKSGKSKAEREKEETGERVNHWVGVQANDSAGSKLLTAEVTFDAPVLTDKTAPDQKARFLVEQSLRPYSNARLLAAVIDIEVEQKVKNLCLDPCEPDPSVVTTAPLQLESTAETGMDMKASPAVKAGVQTSNPAPTDATEREVSYDLQPLARCAPTPGKRQLTSTGWVALPLRKGHGRRFREKGAIIKYEGYVQMEYADKERGKMNDMNITVRTVHMFEQDLATPGGAVIRSVTVVASEHYIRSIFGSVPRQSVPGVCISRDGGVVLDDAGTQESPCGRTTVAAGIQPRLSAHPGGGGTTSTSKNTGKKPNVMDRLRRRLVVNDPPTNEAGSDSERDRPGQSSPGFWKSVAPSMFKTPDKKKKPEKQPEGSSSEGVKGTQPLHTTAPPSTPGPATKAADALESGKNTLNEQIHPDQRESRLATGENSPVAVHRRIMMQAIAFESAKEHQQPSRAEQKQLDLRFRQSFESLNVVVDRAGEGSIRFTAAGEEQKKDDEEEGNNGATPRQ